MLAGVLDGVVIGFLLFILAVGLSLIFGMTGVLNLAHGVLFLGGAYLGAAFAGGGWRGFLTALAVAAVAGPAAGVVLSLMTEPLRRRSQLDQALFTLGMALLGSGLLSIAFGDDPPAVPAPPGPGAILPTSQLLIIGAGAVLALLVYLVLPRTRVGALVRASVADREMLAATGVDTRLVKASVFAVGSLLASTAGVLGGPVYAARPGMDRAVLVLALIVVVVGGLGSVRGALVGALVIGQVHSLGRLLLPELAPAILFAALALLLVVRPGGLAGAPVTATGTR